MSGAWGGAWGGSGSETNSYTRTREQLRDMIARKLRVLGIDRTLSADEEVLILEGMDVRLKALHQLGVLWWKVNPAPTDMDLTANVATASGPTDMLYPMTLHIQKSGDDFPVSIVNNGTYQEVVSKTDTGMPQIAVVYGRTFRFYPVPDQDYTAKLTYQQIVEDSDAATSPDVVEGAILHLKTIIAADLADDFGLPEQRVVRLMAERKQAEGDLRRLIAPRFDVQPVQAEYF